MSEVIFREEEILLLLQKAMLKGHSDLSHSVDPARQAWLTAQNLLKDYEEEKKNQRLKYLKNPLDF